MQRIEYKIQRANTNTTVIKAHRLIETWSCPVLELACVAVRAFSSYLDLVCHSLTGLGLWE